MQGRREEKGRGKEAVRKEREGREETGRRRRKGWKAAAR